MIVTSFNGIKIKVKIAILIPQEISIATKISNMVLIKTLKKLRIPVSPPTIVIKIAKTTINAINVLIYSHLLF